MGDEKQVSFSHRQPKLVERVAHKLYYGSTLYIIMRSAKLKTLYGTFYKHCYIATNKNTLRAEATTVQFSIVHARNSSRDSQAKLTALNRSRTGKIVFLMYSSRFLTELNGCRQRLLFARQLAQRKCSLCSQGTNKNEMPYSFIVYVAICEFLGLL